MFPNQAIASENLFQSKQLKSGWGRPPGTGWWYWGCLSRETMVNANQNHFSKAHVISQLQADIGNSGSLPYPIANISGKFRRRVGRVNEMSPGIHAYHLRARQEKNLGICSA
jgi:hypothetical protein